MFSFAFTEPGSSRTGSPAGYASSPSASAHGRKREHWAVPLPVRSSLTVASPLLTPRQPAHPHLRSATPMAARLLAKHGSLTYGLQRQEHGPSPSGPPQTQQGVCLMPLFIHQSCILNQCCAACRRELWFKQCVFQGTKDQPGHSHTHLPSTTAPFGLSRAKEEKASALGFACQTEREPQSTRQPRKGCYKATLFSDIISLVKLREGALQR